MDTTNIYQSYRWEGKSILIVEDDKFSIYVIENFLKETHANVHIATNGEKAVEMALSLKPNIILMDIYLPGIDGLEATRQIKEQLPDVIIIPQSAFVTDSVKQKAKELGCADFIPKPINVENLLSTIAKHLAK